MVLPQQIPDEVLCEINIVKHLEAAPLDARFGDLLRSGSVSHFIVTIFVHTRFHVLVIEMWYAL